jgi:carbamoyltransferase
VKQTQDPFYYQLICAFGELSEVFAVLNTSLNVMGEPIVETVEDAKRFFDQSSLSYLCLGPYLISR